MDILQKSNELGQLITQSEVYKSFVKAKNNFDNDKIIQDMFSSYKTSIIEYTKTKDEVLKTTVDKCYNELLKQDIFMSYINAKQEFELLMTEVNGNINKDIIVDPLSFGKAKCGGCPKSKKC